MSEQADDFMKRLRERVEARERKERERFEAILQGKPSRQAAKPAQRTTWIDDTPIPDDSVARKASILDLLRDEVTTKSSSRRGGKTPPTP